MFVSPLLRLSREYIYTCVCVLSMQSKLHVSVGFIHTYISGCISAPFADLGTSMSKANYIRTCIFPQVTHLPSCIPLDSVM